MKTPPRTACASINVAVFLTPDSIQRALQDLLTQVPQRLLLFSPDPLRELLLPLMRLAKAGKEVIVCLPGTLRDSESLQLLSAAGVKVGFAEMPRRLSLGLWGLTNDEMLFCGHPYQTRTPYLVQGPAPKLTGQLVAALQLLMADWITPPEANRETRALSLYTPYALILPELERTLQDWSLQVLEMEQAFLDQEIQQFSESCAWDRSNLLALLRLLEHWHELRFEQRAEALYTLDRLFFEPAAQGFSHQASGPTPSQPPHAQLRNLYRQAAALSHPDRVPPERRAEAEQLFAIIREAYRNQDQEKLAALLAWLQGSRHLSLQPEVHLLQQLRALLRWKQQQLSEQSRLVAQLQEQVQMIQAYRLGASPDWVPQILRESRQRLHTEISQRLDFVMRMQAKTARITAQSADPGLGASLFAKRFNGEQAHLHHLLNHYRDWWPRSLSSQL
jgi:hypothetical protein